jgi:hypothetical protein
MNPLDMGQGNSVSTSNAQQSSADQGADVSGNRITFGSNAAGMDTKTMLIGGAILLGAVYFLGRR